MNARLLDDQADGGAGVCAEGKPLRATSQADGNLGEIVKRSAQGVTSGGPLRSGDKCRIREEEVLPFCGG